MQDIRVLVADDEIPARGELKYELATIPGVQIVGECKNGKEVLDFLNVHPNVDILFLDIEMPFMNGLECAKEIQRRDYPVKIVFATGYSQFAVQAFDLEAFDYILKPYDEKRIQRTIKRYADSLELRENHRSPGEIINTSTEKSDRSLFYTTSGIIESRMALRDAEQLLAPHGFFRTHKGYIVNLAMIQELESQDNGTLLLTMNYFPKEKVPVSRHYIKDFKNTLHIS